MQSANSGHGASLVAALVAVTLSLVFGVAAREPAVPAQQTSASAGWPAVSNRTRPWTRWWWHGSAVEPGELSAQLDAMRAAGLGGVEITPIYGVRGTEERFIPFLSEAWVGALEHTLREAARLGLSVDMATGTGWPFGGPWVDDGIAPRSIAHQAWTLQGGERLTEPVRLRQTPLVRALGNQIHIVNEGAPGDPPRPAAAAQPVLKPGASAIRIDDLRHPVTANANLQALALEQVKYPRELPLVALMAFGEGGAVVDLTSRVAADGTLDWTAPSGTWKLYAVFSGWHGKLVERAAPGGEGNVIDHFSREAIQRYLAPFDRALADRRLDGLRAFFNDSYEVDDATGQADWTPRLFDEFRTRRGYDLRQHLDALLGDGDPDAARVLADYRETVSDLLLETFTTEWIAWAHRRDRLVRNQAHGAPANLLDLYSASDIPETEGSEIQRFRWATSAAHVAGKPLVSAEAATWLGEHFRSTLADVRVAVDRFFVAGVNHIVYHGTAYSPRSDPWPGWLFYAAVAFSPQNAWWDDFAELNAYVTRVQSFLQSGRPDHDVLLYYPFYDALARPGKARLTHFGGANAPSYGTPFERAAEALERGGFTFDLVSDRQLKGTRAENGVLTTAPGSHYRVLILPASQFIPLETFEQVLALARDGATVISIPEWPADVSGLADLDARRQRYRRAAVTFEPPDGDGVREARIGRGRVLRGDSAAAVLARAGIHGEPLAAVGLRFHRRADGRGRFYFISNPGEREVDGWVPIRIGTGIVDVFDPVSGRYGRARTRMAAAGQQEVYLQISASASIIVAASKDGGSGASYPSYRASGQPVTIAGPWRLTFDRGGPSLPAARTLDRLASWATLDREAEVFAGTGTYSTTLARPSATAAAWVLDLGDVRETARVRLNGRNLGTLIAPPYRIVLDAASLGATNEIDVSVTNLAANRVRDLDRRGVPWKKFYNVNFPARLPENRGPDGLFTAAGWAPLDSGLIGPVTLTPLEVIR